MSEGIGQGRALDQTDPDQILAPDQSQKNVTISKVVTTSPQELKNLSLQSSNPNQGEKRNPKAAFQANRATAMLIFPR